MKDAERILALEYERDLLYNILQKHRRFHDKVGCPGKPECVVCVGEERFSFMLTNGIGPDEMLLPTKIELTGEA